jgi:hypothetical protein
MEPAETAGMAQLQIRSTGSASGGARLVDALKRYLAQPLRQATPSAHADAQSLAPILRRGDVLLTEGISLFAALVRRLTGSKWSHVSMYVGPLEEGPDPPCVVEADIAAGVRAVPLSEFKGMRVRVLRPTRLADADRARLADWVVSRIGAEYDLAHAWALGRRLLRLPLASPMPALSSSVHGARRFICSSLLAQAFMLVGYTIVPHLLGVRGAEAVDQRYLTPRDFERASVFEVVGRGP